MTGSCLGNRYVLQILISGSVQKKLYSMNLDREDTDDGEIFTSCRMDFREEKPDK